MRRKISALATGILLQIYSCTCMSGSVDGPYVLWLNISNDPTVSIDAKVRAYLNSGDDLCWNANARMYMRKRPPDLTASLATQALIQKSRSAQQKLKYILHAPFDQAPEFDGIIIFSDKPSPRFISLSARGNRKEEPISDISNNEAIKASLCVVMPSVQRLP